MQIAFSWEWGGGELALLLKPNLNSKTERHKWLKWLKHRNTGCAVLVSKSFWYTSSESKAYFFRVRFAAPCTLTVTLPTFKVQRLTGWSKYKICFFQQIRDIFQINTISTLILWQISIILGGHHIKTIWRNVAHLLLSASCLLTDQTTCC